MEGKKNSPAPGADLKFSAPSIDLRPSDSLVRYARNSRKHSDGQIAELVASLEEFGLVGGIVIRDGVIAKGHGTLSAIERIYKAGRLIYPAPGPHAPEDVRPAPYPKGMVPVIDASGWTDAQFKAYVIADNKLALNADWDYAMLAVELEDLQGLDFDIGVLGFDEDELNQIAGGEGSGSGEGGEGMGDEYTKKITIPVYEPKGERPAINELTDKAKAAALIAEIEAADIGDDEKAFLISAASRHVVFDYHLVAEYYCHASPAMQRLMENSALVLIDFEKAVANGYVQMSEKLEGVYSQTHDEDGDDDE